MISSAKATRKSMRRNGLCMAPTAMGSMMMFTGTVLSWFCKGIQRGSLCLTRSRSAHKRPNQFQPPGHINKTVIFIPEWNKQAGKQQVPKDRNSKLEFQKPLRAFSSGPPFLTLSPLLQLPTAHPTAQVMAEYAKQLPFASPCREGSAQNRGC